MTGSKLRGFALATTMVVAACGGSTPATQGPGGGSAGPGPTSGSGQQSSAPVTAAPVTAAPQPTPGGNTGGAFTGDPCSLLTAAEIEAATGVANVVGQSTPMENFVGACNWTTSDNNLGATITVSATPDTDAVWQTYLGTAGIESIPGVGDGALYYFGAVLVRKGGTIVTVAAGPLTADEATKKAASIELAKAIAGRL